jgi:hypothetical protein
MRVAIAILNKMVGGYGLEVDIAVTAETQATGGFG